MEARVGDLLSETSACDLQKDAFGKSALFPHCFIQRVVGTVFGTFYTLSSNTYDHLKMNVLLLRAFHR